MCQETDPRAVWRVLPRSVGPGAAASETIPLDPVDAVEITILCDNVTDALLMDEGPAKRPAPVGAGLPRIAADVLQEGESPDAFEAEHGFSVLVTIRKGEETHRFLFDAGLSPDGMVGNMRRLELSPKDVEAVVLSHGHFDHTTGLDGFVRKVGRPNVPVVVHPEAWTKRRINIPGRDPIELPTPSRTALEDAGFELTEGEQPSLLFDGSVLVTGEVDRTTEFEQGFPVHEAKRDGSWEPDPLIWDDQAMVVDVAGRGLVVLTGCGHSGIVNTVRHAKQLTGVDDVHAVLGGFHLSGPLFEPIIEPTCDALEEVSPDVIVPAHCTGWKATHRIAARFPEAFVQNSVGTRFELGA